MVRCNSGDSLRCFPIDNHPHMVYEADAYQGSRLDKLILGDEKMRTLDASAVKPTRQPYRPLREDPRYDEIKRIIDDLPTEKMKKLKMYIERWLRSS